MKKVMLLIITLVLTHNYLIAQATLAVAPLKPGNKWVYYSYIVSQGKIEKFEVTDSVQIINSIPFYKIGGDGFMAVIDNQFFAMYHEQITDSLYTYFKSIPQKGDNWKQVWKPDSLILYNTIVDTFTANVFGYNTRVYQIDRTTVIDGDSSFYWGSREYWTEEFGMLNGIYEEAEYYLLGCVIDGVVYGDTATVGVDDEKLLPNSLVLYQNYPNPFNPSTNIRWELKYGKHVVIKVYDILGREVKTLVNGYYNPGFHEIKFNSDNLTSGVYIYRLVAGSFSESKKMLLTK